MCSKAVWYSEQLRPVTSTEYLAALSVLHVIGVVFTLYLRFRSVRFDNAIFVTYLFLKNYWLYLWNEIIRFTGTVCLESMSVLEATDPLGPLHNPFRWVYWISGPFIISIGPNKDRAIRVTTRFEISYIFSNFLKSSTVKTIGISNETK